MDQCGNNAVPMFLRTCLQVLASHPAMKASVVLEVSLPVSIRIPAETSHTQTRIILVELIYKTTITTL